MSKKTERLRIIWSESPLRKHSMGSQVMKDALAGEERVKFGESLPPGRLPRKIVKTIFWERV